GRHRDDKQGGGGDGDPGAADASASELSGHVHGQQAQPGEFHLTPLTCDLESPASAGLFSLQVPTKAKAPHHCGAPNSSRPANHMPRRPAARLRLRRTRTSSFWGCGSIRISRVWFMMNMPRLAIFSRTSWGRGLSSLVTDAMKMVHSLRLKVSAG